MVAEKDDYPAESAREIVTTILAPVVGDFIAKTSLSMASKRIGKTAETIALDDLPAVADGLRPPLCSLLGTPTADAVVARIKARAVGRGA